MSEDEMVEIIKSAVGEWEQALSGKILGTNPFMFGAVQAKAEFEGSLDSLDEKELRYEISNVFQQLSAAKNPFYVTEPDPRTFRVFPTAKMVTNGGTLNLTYLLGGDLKHFKQDCNVLACWYLPS